MRRVLSMLVYLASFLLGRGALFVAPLVLSNLLPMEEYGRFEWAQAAGSLGATGLVLGTSAVVPLVMLLGESKASLLGIYAHHMLIAGMCLLGLAGFWVAGVRPEMGLAALFTATLAYQNLWSAQLRTEGKAEASLLLQAGLLGLAALVAVLAVYGLRARPMPWIWFMSFTYTGILAALTFQGMWQRRALGDSLHFAGTLRVGVPLMLSSVLTLLATTSGRFGIGLLAGPLDTAEYAVLARGAAVPIVAHQLIMVARFREVFLFDHKALERMLIQVLTLVALAVVGFWAVSPWLGWMLGQAFAAAFMKHHRPALWILIQSILWSGIALNDLVCSRQQIMAKVLPWTGGLLAVVLPAGWWILHVWGITLPHFVFVHAGVMVAFYLVQATAMASSGVSQLRAWGAALGASVVLTALASFLG